MSYGIINAIPPEVHLEIRNLETKVGEERKLLSDSKLIKDLDGWMSYPRHSKGIKIVIELIVSSFANGDIVGLGSYR